MIITDDVYGTFSPHFRSFMAEIPYNTLCVYSFSKYFGATGWRNAVIALHEFNLFDKLIAKLPKEKREILHRRYSTLTLEPEKLKFIDRMVADSRQVALNHTAGLSLPQQMQMGLFAAFALLDKENKYKQKMQEIIRRRLHALWDRNRHAGLGKEVLWGRLCRISETYLQPAERSFPPCQGNLSGVAERRWF